MGCIREIKPTHLVIQLPCQQVGRVQTTNISKAYTNVLTKMINEGNVPEVNSKSI